MRERRRLPNGNTCGKCIHFMHCEWLVQAKSGWQHCDWYPIRFHKSTFPPGLVRDTQDGGE